jgi:hypothetical protein
MRLLPILLLACAACASVPDGTRYGEPVRSREVVAYSVVESAPADYVDQTLLVEATVTAVCTNRGCWMQVADGGETAMVRWETGCGGRYAFPTDAVGKRVLIQGSFSPKTISPEEAEHLQGEGGAGKVTAGETWELNATAVVVLDSGGDAHHPMK